MKKAFVIAVKAVFGVAKVVLAILGVLFLAAAASLLLDIPGCKRFSRYCSYPDMKALMNAEKDEITGTVAYERGGTNFTFVVLKPCRFLASGCAVLVYDPEGRLFDKTGDEGDDGRFQRAWPRPWCWRDAKTIRQLKAIKMPKVSFCAPSTMKDFAEYMSQATKDFDNPAVPLEKRGIKFVCTESVAAKVGPEKPKQETALIPCGGIGATTTAWDMLTNVCNSVGCSFKVYLGKVEIGKMPEKYDQVHILNRLEKSAESIGIIGGEDGPTATWMTTRLPWSKDCPHEK